MTRDLPPGMVPLSGRFRYRSAETGAVDLAISHGQFSLWKNFQAGQPQDGVALNILIAGGGVDQCGKTGGLVAESIVESGPASGMTANTGLGSLPGSRPASPP